MISGLLTFGALWRMKAHSTWKLGLANLQLVATMHQVWLCQAGLLVIGIVLGRLKGQAAHSPFLDI